MPLIRIDLIKGRTPAQVADLLDTIHQVVVSSFGVPERDRYQIVSEHDSSQLIALDTGLGIERSPDVMIISITSRPRTTAEKQRFYSQLCTDLEQNCGIAASDVIVTFVINADEDWSFGLGRAQFLTGEL